MKSNTSGYWVLAGMIALAAGSRLAAQSKAQITRQHYYVQTGASTANDDASNGPYGFQVLISGNAGLTDTFTPPGSGPVTLAFSSATGTYVNHYSFTSLANLNSTYPDGTYGLAFNGQTTSVTVTGDTYPNSPLVAPSNGAWTGAGLLTVDPTQTLTLTANFTTNFVSGQGYVDIQVSGPGYSNDVNTSGNLAASQAVMTIPAGTIRTGGSYVVTVTMDNAVAINTTAVAGYAVVGQYETKNTFTIQAQSGASGPPSITTQPVSVTVTPGTTAVFNVAAAGAATYQWYFNSAPIGGATSARLVLSGATGANAGSYTCTVGNSLGGATSAAATLGIMSTSNPGRLGNLSVLSNFTAGQSLTVGFVTGGSGTTGTQSLLIRADGPALAAFGVSGPMSDPKFQVIPLGQTLAVAANDNWGTPASNSSSVVAADSATGAFPLTSGSLDAALVATLTAGGYSIQVSGTGPGTALTELYDTTPSASYTLSTPRLVNVSCNSQIAVGSSLTTGFVVGGVTAKTVLIRASGPTLAASFGLSGTMADPKIVVQAAGASAALASNAGWGGDPQISAAGNSVSAFPFASASTLDSAVLVTLAPGSYTAVANSASGGGGVALVEVYEIP